VALTYATKQQQQQQQQHSLETSQEILEVRFQATSHYVATLDQTSRGLLVITNSMAPLMNP